MHWASDLGAADLSRELAEELGTSAVLSRFSRLLVDPNRSGSSPTLFRMRCDGAEVALNRGLTDAKRRDRLERLYEPFHEAVAGEMRRTPRRLVFSIHSFTPEYEGELRAVQIGVLFDRAAEAAATLQQGLEASLGMPVAQNEPWSGLNGLMYSAQTHADAYDAIALELEVRQDLLVQKSFRDRLRPVLAARLRELVA